MGGAVADRIDMRQAGAAVRVDIHAVAPLCAGGDQRGDRRIDADADDREIGLQGLPAGEHDAADATTCSGQRLHHRAYTHVHAAGAMLGLVEARDGLAGDPRQQAVHRLDQHDLAPQGSQNCRRLEADIAAADHRDPVRAHQLVEQPIHLVAVADIVDAAKIGAGAAQPSRRAPRGPDERAKAKAPAIGEGHRPPGRIDGRGRRAEQHLHPALGPEGCGPDQQSFEAFLPCQIVLRQSWPLVRQVRLGADDGDAPFKAVLAKRDRGLRASMAAADDQHVERCHFDVRHRHCAPRCRFNPPSRRAA